MINKFLLIPILVVGFLLLFINVDKKFIGHHDWNGVWYGAIARNHLRLGLIETKFGSVGGNGSVSEINSESFFTHYPPLFPLIMAASISIMGDSEFTMRFVTLLFSLTLVIFIYLVALELYNQDVAFLAGIFTICIPLFIYFGITPVHETLLLPIISGSFYWYIRWCKTIKPFYRNLLLLFLILGFLISWPAYFVPLLLVIHYYLFVNKKFSRFLFVILLPFIFFGLHLMHIKFITGIYLGGGLSAVFSSRISSSQTNQIYQVTPILVLKTVAKYFSIYFTSKLIILVGIWLSVQIIIFIVRKRLNFSNSLLAMLGIQGILYVAIFHEAAFIHDYLIYYSIPFIVISAAVALVFLVKRIPVKAIGYVIIMAFVLLVSLERREYLKALMKSNHSEKGYVLGKFIEKNSKPQDTIYIGSNFYNDFFSPFITYYSHRNVGYGENFTAKLSPRFNLIVRPKAHDALNLESKTYLDTHYLRYEDEDFIWYNQKKISNQQ